MAEWTFMTPGRKVRLQAQSPLYKGTYECSVVAVSRRDVRVTMPMEGGKLVLIPVGTKVSIALVGEQGASFDAVVADRKGGASRSLLLKAAGDDVPTEDGGDADMCPVVAVTSGKGGVGKSLFTVNLGAELVRLGLKVAIVDVDLGTANIDVLLNLSPQYSLPDIVHHEKSIFEVVMEGPGGVIVLPGASGLQDLTEMDDRQFVRLHRQMKRLQQYVDVMLLDTGSGVSKAVTRFVLAADEAVLVTTPEPHAIVDAYALVKVLAASGEMVNMGLVVNKVRHAAEADSIAQKMMFAGERFLQAKMKYLGYVLNDEAADRAVRQQRLLADVRPHGGATQNVRRIAEGIATSLQTDVRERFSATPGDEATLPAGPRTFLQRIRDLFSR